MLGARLDHQSLDIDEIQSADAAIVAEHKARQAFAVLQKSVLVEDSYLACPALGDMPGPFVKFFVGPGNKVEVLARMLDGFSDRRAYLGAVYCYFDGTVLRTFDVRLHGQISQELRGKNGYGWDQIFQPDGYDNRTCAELSDDEFLQVYNQTEGFRALKAFLSETEK